MEGENKTGADGEEDGSSSPHPKKAIEEVIVSQPTSAGKKGTGRGRGKAVKQLSSADDEDDDEEEDADGELMDEDGDEGKGRDQP